MRQDSTRLATVPDRPTRRVSQSPERSCGVRRCAHFLGSSVFALNKEGYVAIARIVETRITPEEYEQMRERLGMGDAPPPGGQFHVAALGEDGKIRIVEVWDSREEAEAWAEKVAAARNEAGFGGGPPMIEYLDVHRVVQR
jgi:hypothetical protein